MAAIISDFTYFDEMAALATWNSSVYINGLVITKASSVWSLRKYRVGRVEATIVWYILDRKWDIGHEIWDIGYEMWFWTNAFFVFELF